MMEIDTQIARVKDLIARRDLGSTNVVTDENDNVVQTLDSLSSPLRIRRVPCHSASAEITNAAAEVP
jgi:hypothetical protein